MSVADRRFDEFSGRLLEEADFHAAAERALARYPGPVGELLHRELSAYARFGHRFATDVDALMPDLTIHLLVPGAPPEAVRGARGRRSPGPPLWPRPVRVADAGRPTTRKDPP
ncbi:hypothetical protein [Actinomycetospora sp. CA-053990]|uniref:hypothetical protein n=1 Tax=Actinomycetospora sp. CA-053990 TaxID=3239891 RepID=UPI003D8BFD84